MRIKEIRNVDFNTFEVELVPNRVERVFKIKPKKRLFKDSGMLFWNGGHGVYIENTGEKLHDQVIIESLDNFKRSWL